MVPARYVEPSVRGTNGVRHENQKKDIRENIQTLSAGKQKGQEKILNGYAHTLELNLDYLARLYKAGFARL
jgi:hypothetical protein